MGAEIKLRESRERHLVTLPKHMPALDGLRGVAILLVLLVHCGQGWPGALQVFQYDIGLPAAFTEPSWMRRITDGGGSGVQLFFVVSAFTLMVQSVRRGRGNTTSFAIRRIARVGPGFWVAAVAYAAIAGLGPRAWAPNGIGAGDFASGVAFLSAWLSNASLAVVPGGWSVSCEVAFYAALPFIVRLVDGRIWRALALTLVALAAAQLRARHDIASGAWGFLPYVSPVQQAPVFLVGVTAALIAMRFPVPREPGLAVATLAAAILLVPFSPVPEWRLLHYLLFSILVAVTVAISATAPPLLLANPVMRRIGEVSYSMYLVHFAVMGISLRLIQQVLPTGNALAMLGYFVLTAGISFTISCVTFKYVERPGIALGARLIHGRSRMSNIG